MQQIVNSIETQDLGKRYGSFWALEGCNITVPTGVVSALVGPNGAGKTTLLRLLVGLSNPSVGTALVQKKAPSQEASFLSEVGYVAQEIPLYNRMTAAQHIDMGAHISMRWDSRLAQKRLEALDIPLDRSVGHLSGGQRAQVGLALALAKRPSLLLLDEPVAALDPVARMDFLTSLAQATAESEGKLTVLMSSHLLSDLERVCDHLIILAAGQTQLCDDIDNIQATHKLLTGPRRDIQDNSAYTVIHQDHAENETNVLVRVNAPFRTNDWQIRDVDTEDIVLAYMREGERKLKREGARA